MSLYKIELLIKMNKKYGKFIEEIEESDEFPRSSKDFDHITLNDANTATKLERQRENNERENALKQNDEIISMRDKSPIITIRIDKNLNDQSDIMHDYNDISQLDLWGKHFCSYFIIVLHFIVHNFIHNQNM